MKKLLLSLWTLAASASFTAQAYSTAPYSGPLKKPMSPYSYRGEEIKIAPKRPVATSVGLTLESRTIYADGYLFINQTIYDRIFWELRGYYIRGYVLTAPPATAVPKPLTKDEENLTGTGYAFFFGLNFHPTPQFLLRPFTRIQYLTNNYANYSDSFGNEILSYNTTYYLGLHLAMTINDVFSMYGAYAAGYQRNNFTGRGFFNTRGKARANSPTSYYIIGFPYKVTQSWTLTPFVQLFVTAHEPNWVALNPPMSISGLTSTSFNYGLRVAYNF